MIHVPGAISVCFDMCMNELRLFTVSFIEISGRMEGGTVDNTKV